LCLQKGLAVIKTHVVFSIGAFVALALASPAQAQVTRTFVSGTGTANSSCSYTAPCRFFTQAVAALPSQGGEIDVLDPGSYGQITLSNSVSIIGRGWTTITATGSTAAITVTGSGSVNINGVQLDGGGTGKYGIEYTGGGTPNNTISGTLSIENSVIRNFQTGILVQPTSAVATVMVKDTNVLNNTNAGIYLTASGSGSVQASLEKVTTDFNNYGMYFDGSQTSGSFTIDVTNSHVGWNTQNGILVNGGPMQSSAVIKNTAIIYNLSGDLVANNSSTTVSLFSDLINTLFTNNSPVVVTDGTNDILIPPAAGTLTHQILQ
jgi:Domain of unknown function (DUF4957)